MTMPMGYFLIWIKEEEHLVCYTKHLEVFYEKKFYLLYREADINKNPPAIQRNFATFYNSNFKAHIASHVPVHIHTK